MIATAGLYDALAPIYDAWQAWNGMTPFARVAAAKLLPILEREAQARAGGDHLALLDAGCGTGTLLLEVARAHPDWRLAGADASTGMLAVAQAKAAGGGIGWARAGLDALPFASAFDACTIFYDTLNHLPDGAALAGVFAAAAAVLRPRGLLVFDVTSWTGFEHWWDGTSRFRGNGWRMILEARFDRAREVATGDITLEHGTVTGRYRIRERYFPRAEIQTALASAGFAVEQQEAWSPFPLGGLGKAWWTARLR